MCRSCNAKSPTVAPMQAKQREEAAAKKLEAKQLAAKEEAELSAKKPAKAKSAATKVSSESTVQPIPWSSWLMFWNCAQQNLPSLHVCRGGHGNGETPLQSRMSFSKKKVIQCHTLLRKQQWLNLIPSLCFAQGNSALSFNRRVKVLASEDFEMHVSWATSYQLLRTIFCCTGDVTPACA